MRVKPGDRVRLKEQQGDYPETPFPAGSTGTVAEITDEHIGVRMDERNPDYDEWDNVLHLKVHDPDAFRAPTDAELAEMIEPEEDGQIALAAAEAAKRGIVL